MRGGLVTSGAAANNLHLLNDVSVAQPSHTKSCPLRVISHPVTDGGQGIKAHFVLFQSRSTPKGQFSSGEAVRPYSCLASPLLNSDSCPSRIVDLTDAPLSVS